MAARFPFGGLMLLSLCCMAAAGSDATTGTAALPGLAASNQRLAAMMQQAQQRPAQQSSPPSLLAFLRGVLGAPVALLMPHAATVPVSPSSAPAAAEQKPQLATAAPPEPAPAAEPASGAAGSGTSSGSTGLSDADIDLINRLFSPSDNTGPYRYDSGLPPLQQLLSMDTSVATMSADRLRQLAKLSEPISWVGRTYVVGGDALLKLRLSPDLQLVIRDVISNSIAQSTNVPASQVLTFAAANVSLSLGFKGVGFGSTDSRATADNHAGLAAVRDALSQLAGGFDQRHIAVSFAPLTRPGQGTTAAAAGSTGRRMLASQDQQQQEQLSRGAPRLVYARFFNVDPANATSILSALSKDCTTAATKSDSTLATPAGFVPGLEVPPICEAIFGTQFVKHSVPVSFTALSVTPTEKPRATVSLSVAVALTAAQTSDGVTVNSTANWLNSTALQDMLHELNLSAQTLPSDYVSILQLTDAHGDRSSSLVNNSNLSGLLSSILALPTPSPAPQSNQGAARGMVVSKGMLAGIIVAAVTSVLALLGVGLLLLLRRPQKLQRAGSGELPTADANRRRRKRRVYHNKFIPAGLAAADGIAASDLPSSSQEAAARPHLERGDSVTSAIKFEADDDESAESAVAETEEQQQQEVGSSSSCSSAVAGRASSSGSSSNSGSRSCRGTGSLAQQRAVELQMLRAAGLSESSSPKPVAVAYSAADGGQSMSIMLSDRTVSSKSYCSRELSSGPMLLVLPWKQGLEAADEPDPNSRRLPQPQQQADAGQGSCNTAAPCTGTPDGVAAVFAAMEAQLAAKGVSNRSGSGPVAAGVQPLGQSCWHAGSGSAVNSNSSSRCSLEQRQGGWPAALPHEQQLQQQWQQQQQQQLKHTFVASPFAQQQGQGAVHQRCSSSSTMVSPFVLQQQLSQIEEEQQHRRQSSSGHAMVSPC